MRTVCRIVAGGALVYYGARCLEQGLDLLTAPSDRDIVREAEAATWGAATTQEGAAP